MKRFKVVVHQNNRNPLTNIQFVDSGVVTSDNKVHINVEAEDHTQVAQAWPNAISIEMTDDNPSVPKATLVATEVFRRNFF